MTGEEHYSALGMAYIGLAAVAGAVTALSFRGWKEMTRTEIVLTLFVSASFSVFVVPWLAYSYFGPTPDIRALAFAIYVGGSGANTFLPLIFRWFSKRTATEGEVGK